MTSKFRTIRVSDPRYERDGIRFVTFKSPALGGRGDVTLYVPPSLEGKKDAPRALLLHGVYGSSWSWAFMGGAPRTAAEMITAGEIKPMMLAMPSDGLWGDGSAYLPHPHADFERFIVEEVPDAVAEATGCAGPLYIAGLSMGGFGALRLGAKHADRFKGISAHSAVTEFCQLRTYVEEPPERVGPIDGPTALEWILRNRSVLPPLRFDCGRSDVLIEANRKLHGELTEKGIPHSYEEFDGEHNWDYWRVHVKETLRFFSGLL